MGAARNDYGHARPVVAGFPAYTRAVQYVYSSIYLIYQYPSQSILGRLRFRGSIRR